MTSEDGRINGKDDDTLRDVMEAVIQVRDAAARSTTRLETRIDASDMNRRFDRVDQRFDRVETRLDTFEAKRRRPRTASRPHGARVPQRHGNDG